MHQVGLSRGTAQLTAEKQELVGVTQPLAEWRVGGSVGAQHGRWMQQAYVMATLAHAAGEHRGVELHAVLAIGQVVADEQELHVWNTVGQTTERIALPRSDSMIRLRRQRGARHAPGSPCRGCR